MSGLVITGKAREKLVKARAGDITLPKVVGMAFGSGGIDSRGSIVEPLPSQNSLNHELLRKECEHTYLDDVTCKYVCKLKTNELVGEKISEVALYDEDGDLVAIKNFRPKDKGDFELAFSIVDSF